jgi:hypothetical protein
MQLIYGYNTTYNLNVWQVHATRIVTFLLLENKGLISTFNTKSGQLARLRFKYLDLLAS